MTAAFPLGAFAGCDTETTDKSPERARLLEICLALVIPGRDIDVRTTLVNPGDGVEIPAEASEINGITAERVRAEGKPVAEVLDVWLGDMANAARSGLPLVIQNAPYDLTVLDREARRNGVPPLDDRLDGHPLYVLDPLVLDKRCIKYRRKVSPEQGARCLKTLAQVYGLPWDDERAHGAEYDTLQAGRVMWKIGQLATLPRHELAGLCLDVHDRLRRLHRNDVTAFLSLAGLTLAELHAKQVLWYRHQTEDFGQWLVEQRNEAAAAAEALADRISEGDPDARDELDEQRAAAETKAAELEQRIASLSTEWPIRTFKPDQETTP